MFQICTSVARRTAAPALTVLAALGASGMTPSAAQAAPTELEPTQAARATSSSYAYLAADWKDWLTESGNTQIGSGQRGFVTWPIDFGAGPITSAKFKMNPINTSSSYGIPVGANVYFNLINEPWSSATPKPADPDGPNVGTNPGTEFVTVTAPGGDFDADITSLLQNWQANPTSYYGVRVYAEAERGGVYAPNDMTYGTGTMANLVLDQAAAPEPAALSVLAVGAALGLGRRRR